MDLRCAMMSISVDLPAPEGPSSACVCVCVWGGGEGRVEAGKVAGRVWAMMRTQVGAPVHPHSCELRLHCGHAGTPQLPLLLLLLPLACWLTRGRRRQLRAARAASLPRRRPPRAPPSFAPISGGTRAHLHLPRQRLAPDVLQHHDLVGRRVVGAADGLPLQVHALHLHVQAALLGRVAILVHDGRGDRCWCCGCCAWCWEGGAAHGQ
jgi:hypothetical protein